MTDVSKQQVIDALWHAQDYWDQSTITYSIPTTSPDDSHWYTSESDGFQALTYGQTWMAAEAFELWDDLISLNLNQNTTSNANITLAYTTEPDEDGAQGYTVTDALDSDDYVISEAQVWINANKQNPQRADSGNYEFMTYVHEIGHALGLSHPGNYNGGSASEYDEQAEFDAKSANAHDTRQYSVMSYFDAGFSGANHSAGGTWYYGATPLLDDILTIQAVYGADMTTRTGNTVYGFNSTANRLAFDFAHNQHPVVAIWDAGGDDTLDTSGFTASARIDLHAGAFSDVAGMTQNIAIAYNCEIENAIGGSGDDTITGNRLDNALEGRDGADTLDGALGADRMSGGRGDDTYWVDNSGDRVIESVNEGRDTVHVAFNYALPVNVEDLYLEGSGNLNGYGNELDNMLVGTPGANILSGGAGRDYLNGVGGADIMYGGVGDDTYFVELGASWSYQKDVNGNWSVVTSPGDQVIEYAGEGIDQVYSFVSYTLPDNVEDLTVDAGLAPVDGTGNALKNKITGGTGDNHLYGLGGDDWLDGGQGDDTMVGGSGNDTYVVGQSGDVVTEAANAGTDTVRSSIDYTLGANLENLTLTGAAVSGTGNALANVITGNAAANTLSGGIGDDRLDGGAGIDRLLGGAGNDTFVFRARLADGDSIGDFAGNGDAAGDHIEFDGFGTARQGATFTRVDTTHWQIHSGLDGHNEVITLAGNLGGEKLMVSDYVFI